MQTESQVVASELERVLPNIPTLYDYEDNFYARIEKSTEVEVISARDMRIPLDIRPGGYFGYFDASNGDLGTGDGNTLEKGVISTVNMKLAIQWDTKSQWATDDKRKAVQNNVKTLLAKSMKEFRRQTAAQCQTAGTGVLATVTSEAAGVFTCTTDGYGVKLLRYGQRINVYNAARTTLKNPGGPVKITAVDLANNTFTVANIVGGVVAGDVILPEGLTGSTPVGLFGVPYHISSATTGSWLGLQRSAFPEVVASGVDAGGADLALPFARLAMNKVGDRIGSNNSFKPVARMHPCQVQAYEELGQLVQMIQKQATEQNLNLYFGNGMQLAGANVEPDFMWNKKRIDFFDPSNWGRAEMKSPGFYEVDGRRIFEMRGPSGGVATSQIFYLVSSWNLFTKNPAANSYIFNLKVPTGY